MNRHWVDYSTYHKQVEANLKLVHDEQMYKRQMAISMQPDTDQKSTDKTMTLLPAEIAQQMEATNVWWVSVCKLSDGRKCDTEAEFEKDAQRLMSE